MKRYLFVFFISIFITLTVTAGDNPRTVKAVYINTSPRIDGILEEEVWRLAQPATDFIQRDPNEGEPASERTEIYILYDDEALYFGCMFYDSEPDKIVARLTRRDNEIESDKGSIRIDSYHDSQTGYEFTFNPAGVKVDIIQYDDGNREDESWDPVWDLQTQITSEGWSAEVKIPFRILRYKSGSNQSDNNTWGINFIRYISRKQEWDRWAFSPKSQSGFISRFGHLTGLERLPDLRPIEALPFVKGRQSYEPASDIMTRRVKFLPDMGIDIKYGISSNFTLDATINPDFGQVEADPAVLNLTTFETFYPEKRPFFVEGTQIFRFTTFGAFRDRFGPGMFYSRRIGKANSINKNLIPEGGKIEYYPQHTTILGAAKVTGRTNSGLSLGILESFTKEEYAEVSDSLGNKTEKLVEPFGHYNVIRLKQDIWDNSNIGMIFTSVAKRQRYPAFTNGYDWNLKFDNSTYMLDGFVALSRSTNNKMERTTGSAGRVGYSKIGGEHWLWSLGADYTTKKYNINDVGFFMRPNDFGGMVSITYKEDVPAEVVRDYRISLSVHERRNFDGVNISRDLRMWGHMLFANYWRLRTHSSVDIGLYDDRETRGKGLYRKPRSYDTHVMIFTDQREDIVFRVEQSIDWDSKSKINLGSEIGIDVKPLSWMEWELNYEYENVRNHERWVQNRGDTSIFGDLKTKTHNFTLRSTITFTRDLTLQLYGQIFLAKGHYNNFRQLIGTSDFIPWSGSINSDFNRQSLSTNMVLRWEYLPGSTLYLVWSQARDYEDSDYFTRFIDDFSETFLIPPSNVILLKISYWLNL